MRLYCMKILYKLTFLDQDTVSPGPGVNILPFRTHPSFPLLPQPCGIFGILSPFFSLHPPSSPRVYYSLLLMRISEIMSCTSTWEWEWTKYGSSESLDFLEIIALRLFLLFLLFKLKIDALRVTTLSFIGSRSLALAVGCSLQGCASSSRGSKSSQL